MYLISEIQRNELVKYFHERPFKEVAGGVQMLMNLPAGKPVVEEAKKDKKVK